MDFVPMIMLSGSIIVVALAKLYLSKHCSKIYSGKVELLNYQKRRV